MKSRHLNAGLWGVGRKPDWPRSSQSETETSLRQQPSCYHLWIKVGACLKAFGKGQKKGQGNHRGTDAKNRGCREHGRGKTQKARTPSAGDEVGIGKGY